MEERLIRLEKEMAQLIQSHEDLVATCKAEFETIGKHVGQMKTENEQRDQTLAQIAEIVSKMISNLSS